MTEVIEVMKMIVLGLAAGVLSGLFGIGGGLVIVPALVLMFGFGIKTAVGTSLFVILLPTGLLGVLEYYRNGEMKITAGLFIAFGVFCGAYFGAKLAGAVPEGAMRRVYAVFLLVVAAYFLVAPERVNKRVPAAPTGLEAVPGGRD
ncbi:MAG: sulfite exporter TauE/SafE family protein [Isosphaerales bacterium]